MLPHTQRLNVSLVSDVMMRGKIAHSPLFMARIHRTANSQDAGSRFSVVISKKYAKTAVERNKLRRRVYSSIRHMFPRISSGYHVVLIAKENIRTTKPIDIGNDLESFFGKNGLLK